MVSNHALRPNNTQIPPIDASNYAQEDNSCAQHNVYMTPSPAPNNLKLCTSDGPHNAIIAPSVAPDQAHIATLAVFGHLQLPVSHTSGNQAQANLACVGPTRMIAQQLLLDHSPLNEEHNNSNVQNRPMMDPSSAYFDQVTCLSEDSV